MTCRLFPERVWVNGIIVAIVIDAAAVVVLVAACRYAQEAH